MTLLRHPDPRHTRYAKLHSFLEECGIEFILEANCPECDTTNPVNGDLDVLAFACFWCGAFVTRDNGARS